MSRLPHRLIHRAAKHEFARDAALLADVLLNVLTVAALASALT